MQVATSAFPKLVHIGHPPELGDLVQPDAPQMPVSQPQDVNITIPFVGLDTDDADNAYTHGVETEVGVIFDKPSISNADFPQNVLFATARLHPDRGRPGTTGHRRAAFRHQTSSQRKARAPRRSPSTSIM